MFVSFRFISPNEEGPRHKYCIYYVIVSNPSKTRRPSVTRRQNRIFVSSRRKRRNSVQKKRSRNHAFCTVITVNAYVIRIRFFSISVHFWRTHACASPNRILKVWDSLRDLRIQCIYRRQYQHQIYPFKCRVKL